MRNQNLHVLPLPDRIPVGEATRLGDDNSGGSDCIPVGEGTRLGDCGSGGSDRIPVGEDIAGSC